MLASGIPLASGQHNVNDIYLLLCMRVSDRFPIHHKESSAAYTAKGIYHSGYADCLLVRSR